MSQRRPKRLRKAAWYTILFWPLIFCVASGWVFPFGERAGLAPFAARAMGLALLGGGFWFASWWNRYLHRDGRSDRIMRKLKLDPWKDFSKQWYLYAEDE